MVHSSDKISARLRIVDEHLAHENAHDLDGIMRTFGATARYDDEPWDAHVTGRDGVRAFYAEMLRAIPDLRIEAQRRHVCDDSVILEVMISGRHCAAWRGLPATGRRLAFPLCAIFTFDEQDRLAGEKIYYDRATVLRQLGVFHEPDRALGRALTAVTHPMTMARVVGRMVMRR